MNGLTDQEYQNLILSVGTHRRARRLSPLEVALLIQKAVEAGMTRKQCADELRIGTSQVSTFLKLLTLTPNLQHLADWRGSKGASISFSTMAELARLSSRDQVKVAESVLCHSLKWKEVVQLVQIITRSGKTIEECISNILDMRPQIETRHLFVGSITIERLRHHLANVPQSDRDSMMSRALVKLFGPTYEASGKLGSKEFTVMSQHDLPQLLNYEPDEIEKTINNLLEATITSS